MYGISKIASRHKLMMDHSAQHEDRDGARIGSRDSIVEDSERESRCVGISLVVVAARGSYIHTSKLESFKFPYLICHFSDPKLLNLKSGSIHVLRNLTKEKNTD